MISRLYFTVTLVVLAWVSISTCRAAGNAINRMTLVYNDTVSELKVGGVNCLKMFKDNYYV